MEKKEENLIEKIERLIGEEKNKDAYEELEKNLILLAENEQKAPLIGNLLIMGDLAVKMEELDLAYLNYRTALEISKSLEIKKYYNLLSENLENLEKILSIPFESREEEFIFFRDWLKEHFKRFEITPETSRKIKIYGEGEYSNFKPLLSVERKIKAQKIFLQKRIASSFKKGKQFFSWLFSRFDLQFFEIEVLIALLLLQTEDYFANFTEKFFRERFRHEPDVNFILKLLSINSSDRREILSCFMEDSNIRKFKLIDVSNSEDTSLLSTIVSIDNAVLSFYINPSGVSKFVRKIPEKLLKNRVEIHEHHFDALKQSIGSNEDFVFYLYGREGAGKKSTIYFVCYELGKKVLYYPLKSNELHDFAETTFVELVRDSLIVDGVILIDLKPQNHPNLTEFLDTLIEKSINLKAKTVLVSNDAINYLVEQLDPPMVLKFELPDEDQQFLLWKKYFEFYGLGGINHEDLKKISNRFPLTPRQIEKIAFDLYYKLKLNEKVGLIDIYKSAQKESSLKITTIAEQIPTVFSLDDIILPDETMNEILEIINYQKYKKVVYDDWGFKEKVPYGTGLSVLFSGPSGTGKTMCASIIAHEFGMHLFAVNLASVVSKYIGETEKNLNRIFNEAKNAGAVLLFDEADSLFAKRTRVSSSVDRYSNMEVNFLLQKMEEYDGIVILTTNNPEAIDEAFKRRIRFKVKFPFPDAELRLRLWQAMIPNESLLDDDVDFEFLAQEFEMSGGHIKNAVLRAAFFAAKKGGKITFNDLYKAAIKEYKEMGKLVREYYPGRDNDDSW